MINYLMDTSALLTLYCDEEGADTVEDILRRAIAGEVRVAICFISLLEIMYRVWRESGRQAALLAREKCLALPLHVIGQTDVILEQASEIKALNRLSLADALIAAAALSEQAVLVHKDPEYEQLDIKQLKLSYK
jgi:ribonuclease VapC